VPHALFERISQSTSKAGFLASGERTTLLLFARSRRPFAGALVTILLAALPALPLQFAVGSPVWGSESTEHFIVRQSGTNYVAESSTRTYVGDLKRVVESAVYNDLKPAGGGTVTFQAGVFDLGTMYFRLEEVRDIVFEGQGMDVTTIQNYTTESRDTEPFNFKGADRVTIRDLTVVAGGTPRTTSDAIDFDKGNDSLVQRVKITYSRGKGIIFDGKDAGWTSQGNTVLDCDISGTNNDGIQFLASTNNRVEGCFIHDTVKDGIEATKSQSNAPQPHKKSNDNDIVGNIIDNAGQNGIRIHSSDRNVITGNHITNSSDDTANQDGIRIICDESITGDDNRVEGNTATDNQATKTQAYGLNIASSLCNRTSVGTNSFTGNKTGALRDVGTHTQYGTTDTTPPSNPTNLQASAVSSSRVDLTWTASTDNVGVGAYDIYRNSSLLTSVGAVTAYSDTTVSPFTTYSYQVRARDAAGNPSGLSNTASVTTPAASDTTPPSAPTNLQATAVSSSRVDLSWTASTDNVGVTAYDIYRNSSLLTSVGSVSTYSDTTAAPSTAYSYQVRARDAAGSASDLSNTVTVTTPASGGAPLFSEGFETGNFANWTSNTGLLAQQQEIFAGSWAARGTTTSAATWAYKTLAGTHSELFYRIRFKVISQGASSTVNLLKLRTATGTALFGLFRNASGNLGYRNEVAAVSINSTTPISTGVWHEVQVRVRINGTSGEAETWFDGVRIASLSTVENFGTTPIGRLQVGENSSAKTYDVAFDDVVAGTSFIT
jgi:parallel beta-helix repeat protein